MVVDTASDFNGVLLDEHSQINNSAEVHFEIHMNDNVINSNINLEPFVQSNFCLITRIYESDCYLFFDRITCRTICCCYCLFLEILLISLALVSFIVCMVIAIVGLGLIAISDDFVYMIMGWPMALPTAIFLFILSRCAHVCYLKFSNNATDDDNFEY